MSKQEVAQQIISRYLYGYTYTPYTGRYYASIDQVDLDYIVGLAQAHDSGLCQAERADERRAFAVDLLNITLASPTINRYLKKDNDFANWQPSFNRCWYARRILVVRQAYGLSVDRAEAAALRRVLSGCAQTTTGMGPGFLGQLLFTDPQDPAHQVAVGQEPQIRTTRIRPLGWPNLDINEDGMVSCHELAAFFGPQVNDRRNRDRSCHLTCQQVQAKGLQVPIPATHGLYPFLPDPNADGLVCQ